jgi:phosphomannomutase
MKFVEDIFKAYDIRGLSPEELSPEVAHAAGRALADTLPTAGKVVVGHDMRTDSEELHAALVEGLLKQGRDVIDIGLVSTDMVYFAVGSLKAAGGAMVTASHNPGKYNGIKLCGKGVAPIGEATGLGDIKQALIKDTFKTVSKQGTVEQRDMRTVWIKHVLSFVDVPRLKPLHMAIDAGNGMASVVIDELEEATPFTIEKMFTDLDGTFPNHPANPTLPEGLKDIIEVVRSKALEVGIAFDGDGDRAVLIDDQARPVNPGILGALLIENFLALHPGATIVYDARASHIVRDTIERLGGVGVRSKVGHSNIKALMHHRGAVLGVEQSAHYYFKDNWFADSGLIAAMVALDILSRSGQSLSEMVDRLSLYSNSGEINMPVGDTEAKLRELRMAYSDGEQDELDGLSVTYSDWWFNVRPSNTEPLLRLSVESKDPKLTNEKIDELIKILKS